MKKYTVALEDYLSEFYEKIAKNAGIQVETVLRDVLFRTAGELAGKALDGRENQNKREKIN